MSNLSEDSLSQPVVEYSDVSNLYELCACRKEQTQRVCRSHEALRRERTSWESIATQHLQNEQFYRSLLEQVAAHLGPDVFISDDGSVQDSPLMLKIPELVAAIANKPVQ